MAASSTTDDFLPECTDCGFCCFFDDPRYVLLFEEDIARLGERASELTVEIKGRRFMQSRDGHCIALVRADRSEERWLCSIHPIRPRLCREFERGCDSCRTTVAKKHPAAHRLNVL
jgi:Fe-S-cluster containining protein